METPLPSATPLTSVAHLPLLQVYADPLLKFHGGEFQQRSAVAGSGFDPHLVGLGLRTLYLQYKPLRRARQGGFRPKTTCALLERLMLRSGSPLQLRMQLLRPLSIRCAAFLFFPFCIRLAPPVFT